MQPYKIGGVELCTHLQPYKIGGVELGVWVPICNHILEPAVHGMLGAGGERTDSHTNPDLNTLVRF